MEDLKDIVVIYHAHCQDGFGAAFAAYKKFGTSATYIACSDRLVPPEGLINKEVYILDYSYSKETLLTLEKENKRLVVLDHHISAKEAVESVKEHVYSSNHSGAYIAWEYFVSSNIPELIKILEIIDLAKDKENIYSSLITYVLSKPYSFEAYEALLNDFEDESKIEKIKEIGKAQDDYLELIIDTIIDKPDFVEFEGHTIACVNFSLPINEKSIALKKLYTKYPPFVMSYRFDDGMIKVSLRGNGEVDLSEIAMKYGGGGHKNAAGFVMATEAVLPFAKRITQ